MGNCCDSTNTTNSTQKLFEDDLSHERKEDDANLDLSPRMSINSNFKNIQNPYVMIMGISDYTKSKNETNLPSVDIDVANMEDLFSKHFGYKYNLI